MSTETVCIYSFGFTLFILIINSFNNSFINSNYINYNFVNSLTIKINQLSIIYITAYFIMKVMEFVFNFISFFINNIIYTNYITYFKLYNDNNNTFGEKEETTDYETTDDEDDINKDNIMFKYLYTSIYKYNYKNLTLLINSKSLDKIPKILKNELCLTEIDRYVYAIIMRLTNIALKKGTDFKYFIYALELLNLNIGTDIYISRNKKQIMKEYEEFIKNKKNLYNIPLYTIYNK